MRADKRPLECEPPISAAVELNHRGRARPLAPPPGPRGHFNPIGQNCDRPLAGCVVARDWGVR